MQRTATFLVTLVMLFTFKAQAEFVRVRLKSVPQKIFLSGAQIALVGARPVLKTVAVSESPSLEISRVHVSGRDLWQIKDSQNKSRLSAQEYLLLEGKGLREGRESLPDRLLLARSAGGIELIGLVPLEEYVQDVLMNEMPLTWPMETLKAQAVAIRSYTQALLRERVQRPYQMESSVLDQVYRKRDLPWRLRAKAQQAVASTRGVVLRAQGQVLKAYYHSDCGGRTVPAAQVWGSEEADAGTAQDDSCPASPHSHWQYALSTDELLRKLLPPSEIGAKQLEKITLENDSVSERVKSLVFHFKTGESLQIEGNEFRKRLGFSEIKSTLFETVFSAGKWQFIGKGFGHGVGLCQWGSRILGQKGFSFEKILKHYYPRAILGLG